MLAVTAGLRIGELLGLKWEDVDLERRVLNVRRTLSAAKSGPTFTTPKNDKGRSINLTERAVGALKIQRQHKTPRSSSSLPVFGKIGNSYFLLGEVRPSAIVTSPVVPLNRCFHVLSCPERCGFTTFAIRALLYSLVEVCTQNSCKNCSDMPPSP